MSKTQSKSAINKIDTDLNSNNLVSTGSIINNPRDALFLTLNPSNNFFLDQENKEKIINISENFTIKQTNLQQKETTLTNRDADLIRELGNIAGAVTREANARRIAIANEQATIAGELAIIRVLLWNIWVRQAEYETLASIVNEFDLNRPLNDMKSNIYNYWPDFMSPGNTADAFNFYSETGTIIPIANYWTTIKLADGKTEEVQINGLPAIALPNWTINLTGITFTNRGGNPYVPTQWYELILNPWAIKRTGGWRDFISTKPLKIIRSKPGTLNQPQQRARYGLFNAGGIPIDQYIQDLYDNNYKESENKALDEIIGDTTIDENKKVLRDRIKNLTVRGRKLSPFITNQIEINDGFREDFFKNVQPTADDISTATKYNDFLRKKIPEHLKTYLEKELKRQMESTTNTAVGWHPNYLPATREIHDTITWEILLYKQEQEDRAQDNFDDSKRLSDKTDRKVTRKRRSPELTKSWLFGILGKKDVSYMRFFSNQSQEIQKQTVSIQTDRNKDKVEFKGYEATLNIGTVNNITINIKMENGEELPLKAGNHIKLIKSLLNEPSIPYGKMRMHMAYNVIKAMLKIAKKNNITLEYADSKIINKLAIDKNDDIILERIDDTTGIREKRKIFSEKDFDAENDVRKLRWGLESCLLRFNKSMEKTHKQYKKATDKKLFGYFSLSRAKFPTSWINSPIKKLINIRKSRTLNFDFEDTKVEGIDKNVSIAFSKNKFTITSDLIEKPISSKNLGKLLNTRIKWKSIFDWMNLAIWWTIYKNMISKLRENSKIANTDFGIKDPVKNRVYFIDQSGEIWFISLANNKNPISWIKKDYGVIKKLPSTGRIMLTKKEAQNEFYQNPLIMWKLMKTMNTRLYSL